VKEVANFFFFKFLHTTQMWPSRRSFAALERYRT